MIVKRSLWFAVALALSLVVISACSQPPAAQPPAPTKAPAAAEPAKPTQAASAPAQAATTPTKAAAPTQSTVNIEAAKKEGKVSYYTSTPVNAANEIAKRFEAKYGIKVELFRSGGEATLQRFQTEVSAGKVMADVLTITDPSAFIQLGQKGLLEPFKPANWEKVPDAAKDPQGLWVAQRLNLADIAYRKDKVTGADVPKKWTDLLDPKYKGKLVHPDPNYTATAMMAVGYLSKTYGWDYYQKLAKNDVMIVQGAAQVATALTSGERLIAAEASDSYTWRDRSKGQPVEAVFPEDGVFLIPAPTSVIKGGPNPNAAKLLAEFMLSDEVQPLYIGEGLYGARIDSPAPSGNPGLDKMKLLPIDYDHVLKNVEQIKAKFSEIFG
ncbi:MAG: ABC transporter substrate-binding protein [Chloroflexi bacterium]|nr:ABC transporter substrate-binding protein [Chloroflexota bacterium]